jgi:hypothetical protein
MAIQNPISDLARSTQHEANRTWPLEVKISVRWQDSHGRLSIRSEVISADQFFGSGQFGAPMSGDFLISFIEKMRRQGPPKVVRRTRTQR